MKNLNQKQLLKIKKQNINHYYKLLYTTTPQAIKIITNPEIINDLYLIAAYTKQEIKQIKSS